MRSTTSTLAFALLLAVAAPAAAEEGTNAAAEKGPVTDAAAQAEALDVADRLAAIGIAREDGAMILQAARLKASIPTRDVERSVTAGAAGEGAAEREGEGTDLSIDALLARAEALAQGDAAMLAMVADARVQAQSRGRTQGPGVSHTRVEAFATDYFTESFRGGEYAHVSIVGDGDTDLDLYIYDENGNEICAALGYTDRESCGFTPRWTGSFRIEVRNLGNIWNAYTIRTN